MMEFLYFPEDKSEYLPAIITLVIFTIGAAIAMYFLYKKSKQEEQSFDEKYNHDSGQSTKNELNGNSRE